MSRVTRVSTAEFDRLVAEGSIREGSRAYLWDGEVIAPMPENPPHANAAENLRDLVAGQLPRELWTVNQARPVELSDGYKPQPDLSVLHGPRAVYRSRTPRAVDVVLLAEVADTTYADDAGEFLRKYAQEGIVQYWIVNIPGRRVEIYRDPDRAGATYLTCRNYELGAAVPLVLSIGGQTWTYAGLAVAEILRDSLEEV
jgi:hypothetical protein